MFSSRNRRAKRGLFAALAMVLGVLSLVPGAMARNAYVTNAKDGNVSVVDLTTNLPIATIATGKEPVDVAIVPDGTRAYVVNMGDENVSVVDTATNAVIATIAVGKEPRGIAISPNGARAYVSNSGDGTLSVVDVASNAVVGDPTKVGAEPDGVAVAPDGTRVFVAQRSGNISVVSTTTNAVVDSVPNAMAPSRLAIGPRGGRGFVTNSSASSVTAFNPVNGSVVGGPVVTGSEPAGIAIEPSGSLAYAANTGDGTVSVIDTSLSRPLSPALGGFPGATGVAVEPGGLRGLVTDAGGNSMTLLDTARNVAGGSIGVGSAPTGVAVVPNQGPTASLFVSPAKRRAKRKLTFHGSGSTDPDGQVATYAWDFGDGGQARGPAATRVHRYRRPGTYTVSLIVEDNEGCSVTPVFTGQTAYCNGSPAAATIETITVADTRGPVLRLAGGRWQRLRGRINVFARCPREMCNVRLRGVVVTKVEGRSGERRRKHRMGRSIAAAPAGAWVRMRPRLPRQTRRAVLRALRRGGTATAKVVVVARDEVGDRTLRRRNARLAWPRRRNR